MKLIYTDIKCNLTEILVTEAKQWVQQKKQVFYIAPSSLSFEKEKKVLELLPSKTSFDIIITRFTQMARYLINPSNNKQTIDDIGLSMLFHRALSNLDDKLKVYNRLKNNENFVQQLVDLYKELQVCNMTIENLKHIELKDKKEDLINIFSYVTKIMKKKNYDSESQISYFARNIQTGFLDQKLDNIVVIIDGFTRFSSEEEALITLLSKKCYQIIIGTYASWKSYQTTYLDGNIYQASVEFLRSLAEKFDTNPIYLETSWCSKFANLTKFIENRHDVSHYKENITGLTEIPDITIWEVANPKEEVEYLAKSIRQKLHYGARYKEILVLVGDYETYQLHIGKTFEKYEIPYYMSKKEHMSSHPLINFIDSLERINRYNYCREDIINLLKSGLFGQFNQQSIDFFEKYLNYADITGFKKFSKAFKANTIDRKYDLLNINHIRRKTVVPLVKFLTINRTTSGISMLKKFINFLGEINLIDNMTTLSQGKNEIILEKEEQIWKHFSHILKEIAHIFDQENININEFLLLLRSGMMASQYRTRPATTDVVNIKSYDLIEPHTSKFVYAIGLTRSNFPKISKTGSLLSDEERHNINRWSGKYSKLDLPIKESLKKNHFIFISLSNSAKEELVLSVPQIFNDTADVMSPYIAELLDIGIPKIEKYHDQIEVNADNIGNYKSVLSQIIAINQKGLWEKTSKEEKHFWRVAIRYLRKKLSKEGIEFLNTKKDTLKSKQLSKDTLQAFYPYGSVLSLSTSAITAFYNSEYKYYLHYVLGLQEEESILPDARINGEFLHKIFEKVMKDSSNQHFDNRLKKAILDTLQEDIFKFTYEENLESQYTKEILIETAEVTAKFLKHDSIVEATKEEISVNHEEEIVKLNNNYRLNIVGKIDRIDFLKENNNLGIVDYKSSNHRFNIKLFYNGLNSQLLTYILALKTNKGDGFLDNFFGAMYLHTLKPRIKLSDVRSQDEILAKLHSLLCYKGIFLKDEVQTLNTKYNTKDSIYSKEELKTLLNYTKKLYKEAGLKILQGHFSINPYSDDGKSVSGDQFNSITGFESNQHLFQARVLKKLQTSETKCSNRKLTQKEMWLNMMKEGLK